jgi:hypothetical protein
LEITSEPFGLVLTLVVGGPPDGDMTVMVHEAALVERRVSVQLSPTSVGFLLCVSETVAADAGLAGGGGGGGGGVAAPMLTVAYLFVPQPQQLSYTFTA